jgi:glycosyltransferase involved in cell wall biosynthesis
VKAKRLAYIANARLPTEKAHGFQICKMCEAFAQNGADVILLHPHRHQFEPSLRERTVFDYYSISPIFQIRTLLNLDVVPLNLVIPDKWFTPVFFGHAMLWGLYAAHVAHRTGADLYYTRASEVAFWLVRFGLPTVYEAHVTPERAQRWLLQSIAQKRSLRLVVSLTSFIRKRFFRMNFPPDRVIVLPDGVDLSLFDGLPGQNECRQQLGLPSGRPIIGYIGRFRTLEMEKGIPELVQATALLPSVNGSEPLLLCVGGPLDAVPAYLDLARRLGVPGHRLTFVERIPNCEVPFWIRACDVVTIPWPWTEFSAYFTSPLKLFEYMAAGVPIVATDLPSLREVLRHGKNAWLVKPDSGPSLSEGLKMVLCNPSTAQRLAAQARCDVRSFTWFERAQAILTRLANAHDYR